MYVKNGFRLSSRTYPPSSDDMLKSDSKSGTTGTPASELAWVTVTHPDQVKNRTFQKKIHNHVMKDIGMSRRRKPKRAQDTSDVPPSGLDINKLSDAHPSPMTDRSLLTRGVSARYQRLHGYCMHQSRTSMQSRPTLIE